MVFVLNPFRSTDVHSLGAEARTPRPQVLSGLSWPTFLLSFPLPNWLIYFIIYSETV